MLNFTGSQEKSAIDDSHEMVDEQNNSVIRTSPEKEISTSPHSKVETFCNILRYYLF